MDLESGVTIHLNRFQPRSYQLPIFDALENKKYRRILAILPRRAGKDICAFNIMLRAALRKVGIYYYVFPTYRQGKMVIWDGMNNDGQRFLDYIPRELIERENKQEMKLRLKNGSLLQVVGSDNYDSLMGTNPIGIVFSEYALQDPTAYQYLRPILTANNGWAIFLSTPRGKNHLWELYQIAQQSPQWFCYKLTLDDTQHIPLHEIEREKAEGIMSEDLIQQEYYTSFTLGVEGAYYVKYLDKMRLKGQIGIVPWEPDFKVYTAWDLGVRDSTTIIFFQIIGQTIRIIDCYENSKEGLEHYVKVLEQHPYSYGKYHIAPHDIANMEWGSGMTRLEKARQLGINFIVSSKQSIPDGIEAVRTLFAKCWIDEKGAAGLLKALGNYRQEFDAKKKVYKSTPLHDWSSHYCFTGDTLILTRNGMRPIMSLEDNDEVMTLEGWKPCLKAQRTHCNVEVVEVKFEDGTRVKCTPDHLFLMSLGVHDAQWRFACRLEKGTKIRSPLMRLHNISRVAYTGYIRERNTSQKVGAACIEMRGRRRLGKFRRAAISIIKMVIRPTIASKIWNAYQREFIGAFLSRIIRDLVLTLEKLPPNGTPRPRESYGIDHMLEEALHGLSGNEKQEIVSFVKDLLNVSLEKMGTSKNSATRIVKLPTIESVEAVEEKYDVWDIEVPHVGHFCLENGAIVHNSDAMRYLALNWKRCAPSTSSDALDARFQEAIYGKNNNMPSVFRDDLPPY